MNAAATVAPADGKFSPWPAAGPARSLSVIPVQRDLPPLWAQRARPGGPPPAGGYDRGGEIARQERERIDVASIRLRFAVAVLLAALAILIVIAGLAAIS